MTSVVIYEYKATSAGGQKYDVDVTSDSPVAVTVETLSQGDTFTINGKKFQYLGGADKGGKEIGFFASNGAGKVFFFSTTPLTGNVTAKLDSAESFTTCFMPGTLIATGDRQVAVEDLAIGDGILTSTGETVPVRWIGRQTISSAFADPLRVAPIRVKAGALGQNLPVRDLRVSPCHALLVEGVLIHAGALVNGTTIVRETQLPDTFTYYHIEVHDHSLLLAEGVPAETFIDNVDRMNFDNWEEHDRLYPAGPRLSELPYPRAASRRQVPQKILERLESLAYLAGFAARDVA